MSAAAAERVRSAREVKCATHSSPQQLARGALLSALRPRTLRAPTLFYVPAVLSLAPALRLGGGHFGAGSARSGNKPNPGARAHAGMLHPCASRAPTSQKVDDKSHSRAMCVLVPQAKGGVQKYENGKTWPVDRFVAERYVKDSCPIGISSDGMPSGSGAGVRCSAAAPSAAAQPTVWPWAASAARARRPRAACLAAAQPRISARSRASVTRPPPYKRPYKACNPPCNLVLVTRCL